MKKRERLGRAPRERDPEHLAAIRDLQCISCGTSWQTEAAHVRYADAAGKTKTGIGEKPSDMWTVPLCGKCHAEQHGSGERRWWINRGINPLTAAKALYAVSPDLTLMTEVVGRFLIKDRLKDRLIIPKKSSSS